MKVELRELSEQDGDDILQMIREIGPGENGFMNDQYDMEASKFISYLLRNMEISKGVNLPPNWVPQTMYWAMDDGHPVGICKIRSYLSDSLKVRGGHIGYCIRPSERGKGYGKLMLAEALKKAREKNIPKVLITCTDTNIPSRKVAEYNGARLEKMAQGQCYYWVGLTEDKVLRPIHIDDYDEIYSLWFRTKGMGLSNADSRENMTRFLLQNNGLSFCYQEDKAIVGTILCGQDGRRGYIYHVIVAEGYRGKGIGRLLVKKSLEQLKNQGIDKCHLFVFKENGLGNHFWASTGWTKREDIFVYSR